MISISEYLKTAVPQSSKGDGSHYYQCPRCKGNRKLEVHVKKKLWFCHKCGTGGRTMGNKKAGLEPFVVSDYSPWNCHPADSSDPQYGYLRRRGLKAEQMYDLRPHQGPSMWRVYFPLYDLGGSSPVFFTGRLMVHLDGLPTYLNPHKEMFPKSKTGVLWGIHRINQCADSLILCEGIFDAVGQENGLALLGKRISGDQIDILRQIDPKEVIVMLDSDAYSESMTVAYTVGKHIGCQTHVVRLPCDTDPGLLKDCSSYLKRKERVY